MNHYLILTFAFTWCAMLVIGWLGWQLLRQNGRVLLRLDELEKRLNELEFGEDTKPEGLPLGSEAPAFDDLPDLAGGRKSLAQYRGQPLLLIFFNPACGFCRDLAPKLMAFYRLRRQANRDTTLAESAAHSDTVQNAVLAAAPQSNGAQGLDGSSPELLIISTGSAEDHRELFSESSNTFPVLLQKQSELADAYRARGTPSGYLINADGKIGSGLAMGGDALFKLLEQKVDHNRKNGKPDEDLLASNGEAGEEVLQNRFSNGSLARSKIKRDGLKAGTMAPDFRLPRLDGGGELALSDLRGRQVLLVFSSPGCGPCNTLGPELEKFHREHPDLEMLMVSKGEAKENRVKVKEHGLTFPVVLQQQWEISRRYAMFATPIAYLIDQDGVIVHDVAVGNDAILGLLTSAAR